MRQRIFSHFQDYLIQYISHQYQDLLYCNSSQYILSTYNSQYNNNNNVPRNISYFTRKLVQYDILPGTIFI